MTRVTTTMTRGEGTSAPGRVLLTVETGPSAGLRLVVGGRPAIIGAGADCALVLADEAVSAKHLRVRGMRDGVHIADLGSRNGSFLDGVRVLEGQVRFGGAFQIGSSLVRVQEADGPELEPSGRDRFGALVGGSRAMREVYSLLEAASRSDATVLLEGPSGTGKELAARALHDHSPRKAGPFIAFDAGSTQRELLASSLFGHVKGAFTGAITSRAGAFVEASGGTLFLDELGELPLESQTHLLRVLETRMVTPVGSDRAEAVDVRVVGASNRDLAAMVADGRFRLDLYHRISVVSVRLPPLRERLEDIPAIVGDMMRRRGLDPGPIDGTNLEKLRSYAYPGNVRELKNVIERSLVLAAPGTSAFGDLKIWIRSEIVKGAVPTLADVSLPFKDAKERLVGLFEEQYLTELMRVCRDNVAEAARRSGLSRRHLGSLLVSHGLRGQAEVPDDE